MSEFTAHTMATAPQASRPLLNNVTQQIGFIPNLYAALAESPVTLEACLDLMTLFDSTAFTVTERQIILLTISRYRNCCYCLATHGTLANTQKISSEIIQAVYFNQSLFNSKLEALRIFTRSILEANGWIDKNTLQTFYQAGYQKQHVLEVVLGISFKTLSNYVNHINDTPIDAAFLSGIPANKHTVSV